MGKDYFFGLIYNFLGFGLLGLGFEKAFWFANLPLLTKNLGDAVLGFNNGLTLIAYFGVGGLLIGLGYLHLKRVSSE